MTRRVSVSKGAFLGVGIYSVVLDSVVGIGLSDIHIIDIPPEEIWEVIGMYFLALPPPATTVGTHGIRIIDDVIGELVGASYFYNVPVGYKFGRWVGVPESVFNASDTPDNAPRVNMVISAISPMRVVYFNDTDGAQTLPRELRITVKRYKA